MWDIRFERKQVKKSIVDYIYLTKQLPSGNLVEYVFTDYLAFFSFYKKLGI